MMTDYNINTWYDMMTEYIFISSVILIVIDWLIDWLMGVYLHANTDRTILPTVDEGNQ